MAASLMGLAPEFDQMLMERKKALREVDRQEALREVDRQEEHGAEFACYTCLRMLPKDHFPHKQCRDKVTSRKGARKTSLMTRICMSCAVSTRFYRHLQPVTFRGALHYHCHHCGELAPEARRCRVMPMPYYDMAGVDMLTPTTVCFPDQYHPGDDLTTLERLPRDVVKNIVRFLRYKDALRLEMVSQWMHKVVKPAEMVILHERYLLVEARVTGRNRGPFRAGPLNDFQECSKLPCFVCFRVRDREHFKGSRQVDMARKDKRGFWRMRCNECLHRMYGEGGEDRLGRYRMYETCGRCRCLKKQGRICMFCAEYDAVPEPISPWDMVPEWPTYHVGSYDPWRGRSYLTPETYPLKKRSLRRR